MRWCRPYIEGAIRQSTCKCLAKVAENKVFLRSDDAHWVLLGAPPKTPFSDPILSDST